MSVLFWNVRGLGSKGRKAQLKKIVQEHQIKCLCISETIKQNFTNRELQALGGGSAFTWNWIPPTGRSGGLIMGVDEEFAEVIKIEGDNHFQAMNMVQRTDGFTWRLISVYGPVKDNQKQEFLQKLEVIINDQDIPTLIGGDFNLIRQSDEKSTGNANTHLMDVFNAFVADTELREIRRGGGQYTWTNKQINPIMVVLDRVFMNTSWESRYPLVKAYSVTRIGSDHNPLVVDLEVVRGGRSKIFRFEAAWAKQDGFKDWVLAKWPDNQNLRSIDLWQRISSKLRSSLRGWNGNWGSDMRKRKQDLLLCIKNLDKKADEVGLTDSEWELRYKWEEDLTEIYGQEELIWQTRGGERWILEGDANTAYFHGIANGRKRKTEIKYLENNDEVITEVAELQEHITNFYKELFGSEPQTRLRLASDFWGDVHRVSQKENEELIKPFSVAELEEVVKGLRDSSAPGPDGFSALFFKLFWGKIKGPIMEMLQDFREGNLDIARLNYGIITLIPKIKGPVNIRQFRPICLLNVVYKIITKTLTLRLNKVADKLISPYQTAFIPGRHILDGVVVIHEVLHELAKCKQSGIILKLDFEKAYDKVNWNFLKEVMSRKGFSEKWIEWIMKVVCGGRVAVNLNGELGKYFRSYKGLRQGDPLSPLLFNLVADGLSGILSKASARGVIEGVTPHLVEGGLTHLQYADDTVLFIRNSKHSITNLKFLLFCYEEVSGMKINYNKSEVFALGINEVEAEGIAKVFNCKLGHFPMKYLGLPISFKRLSKEDLSFSANKVEKRLETWKCNQLSHGGRSILINSSLSSIPMYSMGFYWLYDGIHKRLDSVRGRFFWEGVGNKKKYHLVKWEAMASPKEFGGLGFIDTRAMNTVLLAKWIFKLDRGDNNLALDVLRKKYLKDKSFCQVKCKGSSQFWQGLEKVKDWYERGLKWKIGNGKKIRFWHDVWLKDCPLKVSFPRLFKISRQQDWSVFDFKEVDWELDMRRRLGIEEVAEWNELQEALDLVCFSDEEDKAVWALENSGNFSTKSLYRLIKHSGSVDLRMLEVWGAKLPLKIRIFLWMLWHDRVLTGEQMRIRKSTKSEKCKYCGKLETRNHLFFNCNISKMIWVWVRVSMRWTERPTSMQSFEDKLGAGLGQNNKFALLFILASVGWSLWKTRNDWIFNHHLIKSPKAIAYKVLGFLSQWKKMLKPKEVMIMEDLTLKLQEGLKAW
jgi:exonuclease III